MQVVPRHLKGFIEIYDLRGNNGRYDIVFTIDKRLKD
jgi:hypothetical protein